ncbi:MAG TPA: pyrroloquinoline quinone biosynthesis peptide chaperone PqqD [Candidatus Competibacteraceae bacterium]|nr:pyrroloquinoline quinone biosynthesis peptide chaperone PqqD [Candidatus Competibacteraceae bacterium]
MTENTPIVREAVVALHPMYLLRWEEPQQAYVLLYPEGVVKLNQTAAAILRLCDGSRTVAALIGELENQYTGAGIADSVRRFLEVAHAKGWIRLES